MRESLLVAEPSNADELNDGLAPLSGRAYLIQAAELICVVNQCLMRLVHVVPAHLRSLFLRLQVIASLNVTQFCHFAFLNSLRFSINARSEAPKNTTTFSAWPRPVRRPCVSPDGRGRVCGRTRTPAAHRLAGCAHPSYMLLRRAVRDTEQRKA